MRNLATLSALSALAFAASRCSRALPQAGYWHGEAKSPHTTVSLTSEY
jgi:hypothetical protein